MSLNLTCASPLKHADPVSGATLASVSLVTRHGIRTPMDRWDSPGVSETWLCDSSTAGSPRMHVSPSNGYKRRYFRTLNKNLVPFPPNCDFGDLLIQGMNQHYELGKFYRDYLVNQTSLLPAYLDSSTLLLRASRVERTVRSAVNLMNGLYPPAVPGEQLSITTGTDAKEVLYPDSNACSEMKTMWDAWTASDDFKTRMNASVTLYKPIYQAFNFSNDGTNWMFIGDWMASVICSDQSLPDFVTDEMVLQGLKDIAYFSFGYFGYSPGIAGSPIWRQVLGDIDNYIAMKQGSGKFRLYSSHDTTIIALLVSLGYTAESLPPFRSHFLIELWQPKSGDLEIRFVYNGEPVNIGFMDNQTLVSYSSFKTKLSKLGYLSHCLAEFPVK